MNCSEKTKRKDAKEICVHLLDALWCCASLDFSSSVAHGSAWEKGVSSLRAAGPA